MWNIFKVTKKDTRMKSTTSFWDPYCIVNFEYVSFSFSVPIVAIKHVNVCWVCIDLVTRFFKQQHVRFSGYTDENTILFCEKCSKVVLEKGAEVTLWN